MQTPITFSIRYEWDIVQMRGEVREIARSLGFNELDQARIVQSISELARNVIQHAVEGTILVETIQDEDKKGLRFVVQDLGPGIPNLGEFLRQVNKQQVGETSGLQQVQMLMDEFVIRPLEKGTCVEVTKWLKINEMAEKS